MSVILEQYKAIKTKYPGAILLFRVGDFYETYNDDAVYERLTNNLAAINATVIKPIIAE